MSSPAISPSLLVVPPPSSQALSPLQPSVPSPATSGTSAPLPLLFSKVAPSVPGPSDSVTAPPLSQHPICHAMVVAAASLVESPPVHQYGVKHVCSAKLMDTGFIPGYVWDRQLCITLTTIPACHHHKFMALTCISTMLVLPAVLAPLPMHMTNVAFTSLASGIIDRANALLFWHAELGCALSACAATNGYVKFIQARYTDLLGKVVALPPGLSASSPAPKCTRTTASVKGKGKMSDTILGLWPKLWNPHNHGMVLIWPMLEVSWFIIWAYKPWPIPSCLVHNVKWLAEFTEAGGLDETTHALHTKIKEVTALFTKVDWLIEFSAVAGGLCDHLICHSATLCHAQAEVIEQCVNECLFADRVPDLYEIVLVMIHEMHDSGKISISNLKWHQCRLFIARQEDVLLRDSLRGLFSAPLEEGQLEEEPFGDDQVWAAVLAQEEQRHAEVMRQQAEYHGMSPSTNSRDEEEVERMLQDTQARMERLSLEPDERHLPGRHVTSLEAARRPWTMPYHSALGHDRRTHHHWTGPLSFLSRYPLSSALRAYCSSPSALPSIFGAISQEACQAAPQTRGNIDRSRQFRASQSRILRNEGSPEHDWSYVIGEPQHSVKSTQYGRGTITVWKLVKLMASFANAPGLG
ncbi:hypothetical protein BJY52DRAFT_1225883 [Lactarius psammicola]|nr:hypothetical protein BJY52DRAFT_1225883 [Lactarius psammicola]